MRLSSLGSSNLGLHAHHACGSVALHSGKATTWYLFCRIRKKDNASAFCGKGGVLWLGLLRLFLALALQAWVTTACGGLLCCYT